jgi:hypothetical protein
LTIAASSPRKRADLVLAHRRGEHIHIDHVWRQGRGSSDAGKLIWLVGPSGSGKDSLLAALRQREHPQLLVAHRYITRPFNAGSENHIALSERSFLPAPSSIFCSELARQQYLLWHWRGDRPVAARRL